MIRTVCYGEILWDIFPEGKQIGGAPFNVARQLLGFGFSSRLISAIGKDGLGDELHKVLKDTGFSSEGIQETSTLETGSVIVHLDNAGSATYDIKKPVAWDAITVNSENRDLVDKSDVFIYGSLAARSKISRASVLQLLKLASFKVFDANLRPPHYELETLELLMKEADLIKLNEEELHLITSILTHEMLSIEAQVLVLYECYRPDYIAITLGEKGALLFYNGKFYNSEGYAVKVKDTVGAGDAFLAALISRLITSAQPKDAIDFACAIGALVASKAGANPNISKAMISKILRSQ